MTSFDPNGSGRLPVESDSVYTVAEKDVASLPSSARSFEPGTYPLQYEFEFNDEFIVATLIQSSGTKFRVAYQGDFGYKNGLLTSAKMSAFADRYVIPEADGSLFESGFTASGNSQAVANPDRVESWFFPPFLASSTSAQFTQIDSVLTDDQGKSAVTAFGGGRFFADGWESSAFSSNLL